MREYNAWHQAEAIQELAEVLLLQQDAVSRWPQGREASDRKVAVCLVGDPTTSTSTSTLECVTYVHSY
jgi:hypothetical protein